MAGEQTPQTLEIPLRSTPTTRPNQVRDVWSALGQLGGVAKIAFKFTNWQSSEAHAWLKTSLPIVPNSYSHLEHPRRDFEQAVVQRVSFYERNRNGFPAVSRIVGLLGGWDAVQILVRQALAGQLGSPPTAENQMGVVVSEMLKHVSTTHRDTPEGVNWGRGAHMYSDRKHGKRDLLRAVVHVALELPFGVLWLGESLAVGLDSEVGLDGGALSSGTPDAAGESFNPVFGSEPGATVEVVPSSSSVHPVQEGSAVPNSGDNMIEGCGGVCARRQQQEQLQEQALQLEHQQEQNLPCGSALHPAKKARVAKGPRREKKCAKQRSIEKEIESLEAKLLAKRADLERLTQSDSDSDEDEDEDMWIHDDAAAVVCDFWLGATTGLLEKLGFCSAGTYLEARPGALEWHRRRSRARQTLGEPWFRYDYTSLMLYELVLTCADVGTQLLHIFSVAFLWQRWGNYRALLAEYETKCGRPFAWTSFDHAIFEQCLACGLGNAYGRYRMLFWEEYAAHNKLYTYNQKGLFGHFLGQLMSVGFAGFERLLQNGGGGDALLEWISSLGVPIQSRSVEFVLLCLQRHLGVIYGVASLDKLDFVGGGAVDELGKAVGGTGSATQKLIFFHNWFLASLPEEVLQFLGPWTLADTEHLLCEMRRSREAYEIVCSSGRDGEVFEREGACERRVRRVRALLTIRAHRPLFFPLPALGKSHQQ